MYHNGSKNNSPNLRCRNITNHHNNPKPTTTTTNHFLPGLFQPALGLLRQLP
jgi:hypothetical protein